MLTPRALPLLVTAVSLAAAPTGPLGWTELAPIPDREGFAGSYAGVSGGALLVAGGANFPDRRPWEGGTKVWHDAVFVLETPDGSWRRAGTLPRAGGYGVALTAPEGALFIGGGDANENFRDVRLARWDGRSVTFQPLPALPVPLVMSAGALLGRTVYVAGGLERPDAVAATRHFLALDLDRLDAGWRQLEPWPGPARFLATAGAADGSFFLVSGAQLVPGPDGKPQREWRRDAWRYTPGRSWKRLADLPKPLVASPGPAAVLGATHLLVFGGDDGSLVQRAPAEHPGFPRDLWAYQFSDDTWSRVGSLPFSLVTTTVVPWHGRLVVPGGEQRPGVRSNAVWAASMSIPGR